MTQLVAIVEEISLKKAELEENIATLENEMKQK